MANPKLAVDYHFSVVFRNCSILSLAAQLTLEVGRTLAMAVRHQNSDQYIKTGLNENLQLAMKLWIEPPRVVR